MDAPVTGNGAPKPGYKTTEFWLSTAALLLGILTESGAIGPEGLAGQILGGAMTVLAALGYTTCRTVAKKS